MCWTQIALTSLPACRVRALPAGTAGQLRGLWVFEPASLQDTYMDGKNR